MNSITGSILTDNKQMKSATIVFLNFFLINLFCTAQEKIISWDNTLNKSWPAGFHEAEIKSSADASMQKAIVYKSRKSSPQPLIISLHTWSGDYLQEDPLAKEVQLHDWNYIHPDFRGKNNRPEACGSDLVIRDLEDAIQFAIQNGKVDTNEVHIIGASGGGYATLLAFMRLNYPVKSFNAWVSISNLEEWYWECKGRGLKYANDIEGVTTNGKGFDPVDAQKRSPILMPFSPEKRKNSSLHIYAGIHDGYTGSVCILQSIQMFNKLLGEIYPEQISKRISEGQMLSLIGKRTTSNPDSLLWIGGRKVHLLRELPQLSLCIFEGSHEMIVPQALALIPMNVGRNKVKLNILAIGDSNGAAASGWPAQLSKLLPFSTIINKSISGNTIGFDNLGQEKLNTLKNAERYLDESFAALPPENHLSMVIIGLGTNDAKKIFENQQSEVPKNVGRLITKIREWAADHQQNCPKICLLSPPPIDEEKADKDKYGGSERRINRISAEFRRLAKLHQIDFLDIHSVFSADFSGLTVDGVHLTEPGMLRVASEIEKYLLSNK